MCVGREGKEGHWTGATEGLLAGRAHPAMLGERESGRARERERRPCCRWRMRLAAGKAGRKTRPPPVRAMPALGAGCTALGTASQGERRVWALESRDGRCAGAKGSLPWEPAAAFVPACRLVCPVVAAEAVCPGQPPPSLGGSIACFGTPPVGLPCTGGGALWMSSEQIAPCPCASQSPRCRIGNCLGPRGRWPGLW